MSQKTSAEKKATRGKTAMMSRTSGQAPAGAAVSAPSPDPLEETPDNTPPDISLAEIMARLDRMETRLDTRLNKVDGSLKIINETTEETRSKTAKELEVLEKLYTEVRSEHLEDRREIKIMKRELEAEKEMNRRMNVRLNAIENNSRICNLLVDGKAETEGENLRQFISDMANFLTKGELQQSAILSVYRIGKRGPTMMRDRPVRPRQIKIVFATERERNMLFYARTKLKDTANYRGIYLNDDVTGETRQARDHYRSVAALARSSGATVKVHGDGVILNGQKYKLFESGTLPPRFSIQRAKTIDSGEGIYFHSEFAFLSNFYPAPILADGVLYLTAEHRFQARKCLVANDYDLLARVIEAPTPLEAKRIADTLPESGDWLQRRDQILEDTVSEKFDQNKMLAEKLLLTGEKPLYEATTNRYYGIGAALHSREVRDKNHTGLNKLGKALESKRQSLKERTGT